MFKVIDTHTHFDAEEFDEDRAEAFARAKEAGVCPSCGVKEW